MLKGQTPFLRAGLLTPGRKAEITDFFFSPQAKSPLRTVPAVGGSRLTPVNKPFSVGVLGEGAGNFPCEWHPSLPTRNALGMHRYGERRIFPPANRTRG